MCRLLFSIISMAHSSMPNSILISWLYILTACIRVSNSFHFLQTVWYLCTLGDWLLLSLLLSSLLFVPWEINLINSLFLCVGSHNIWWRLENIQVKKSCEEKTKNKTKTRKYPKRRIILKPFSNLWTEHLKYRVFYLLRLNYSIKLILQWPYI